MRALDLMTSPVKVVAGHDPVTRATRMLQEWEIGLLPVVFDDAPFRLQGVITERDIQTRCTRKGHGPGCRVEDHMTRGPLVTVGPEASVEEVLDRMETSLLRRVLVVRGTRLIGLIALSDVAREMGHLEPRRIERTIAKVVGGRMEAMA
jgi:CBS domain-containing protein